MSPEPADELALGLRIRSTREARGRSLRSVADAAGISESFLSQVERGVASPSVASLRGIAEALGESIASFFEEREDGPIGHLVRVADRRRLVHPKRHWVDLILTPRSSRGSRSSCRSWNPGRVRATSPTRMIPTRRA